MKLTLILFLILPLISFAEVYRPAPPSLRPRRSVPKSYYTVVAPVGIRQGQSYNIHIRGFNIQSSIYLSIKIIGTSETNEDVNVKKTAKLSSSSTKATVKIDTSDFTNGAYTLLVEGGGISEKRTLSFIAKKYSFFILLNKSIFFPGDLVQYKVFATDSDTKAVTPKCDCNVALTDPNGNTISNYENVSFKKGSYKNELQLSSKASMGIWEINVKCDNDGVTKKFEVAEYTLPLVTMQIVVPRRIASSAKKVPITVDVSYAFGGDASGVAVVTVADFMRNLLTRNIEIVSGSGTFEVDIVKDLEQTQSFASYQVHAVFNETLTNTKITESARFSVSPYNYMIIPNVEPLQPGRIVKFTVRVRDLEEKPAPAGTVISVFFDQSKVAAFNLTLDADASASHSFKLPNEVETMTFKTKDGNDAAIRPAYIGNLRPGTLEIKFLTEKNQIKLNEECKIMIRTSEPTDYVILHIMSKGVLLQSSKVYFDDDSNESNGQRIATFSFTPTLKNIPTVSIIGYYIAKYGYFAVGHGFTRLDNHLNNYLKITPNAEEVKPGSKVDFKIESNQYSTVSLVAVDQRNLMLRSGGNITKENLYWDLVEYGINRVRFDWKNVAEYEYIFGDYGMYIFTNIPRPPLPKNIRRTVFESKPRREESRRSNGPNEITVRQDFRESFLWRDVDINSPLSDEYYDDSNKGSVTISEKVPESITNYVIYGVSMNKYDGIGLSDIASSLNVFLPFFLSIDFPYSVKRNEVLLQDILIFNYLRRSQNVEVRITKDSKYQAIDLDKYGWTDSNRFYVKTVNTQANKNTKIQFALEPKVIGFIQFEVIVKGPLAGDGIKKPLRVIHEGIQRSITSSVLIPLDSSITSSSASRTLSCNLPNSAFLDTAEISASVVGDIFGKALSNLNNLIRMPSGCGEQTMLSLAPNIAVYQYLSAANKLSPSLKSTLVKYISGGYINELRYQRYDGSFSAFGNSDPSGSTWLSAYVFQYFYYAKSITSIDSKVIRKAADFVVKQQRDDGAFKEPGRVIHTEMQGLSGKGIALTAYCTIALSNILEDYPEYTSARDKAIEYLEKSFSESSSTYDLAVISYALKLAKSTKANEAFSLFDARSLENDVKYYWVNKHPPVQIKSIDIEITSYGLLNCIKRKENLTKRLLIVQFLVSQSNSLGGYSSSQDTVMALYALSQFSKTFSINSNVDLTLKPNIGDKISATIDSSNTLTLQSWSLNQNARRLDVQAKSDDSGLAVVSLICDFYDDPNKAIAAFEVTYKVESSCATRISFDVCAKYLQSGASGMAIMTVTMPSGFVYSKWGVNHPDISRIEVENQDSQVTFYFNSISSTASCIRINAFRKYELSILKGGIIFVYNYYNPNEQGMTSYPAPDSSRSCYLR